MTADDVREAYAQHWETFRVHRPTGGYLPTGVVNGDCRQCGHEWPCPTVVPILARREQEAYQRGQADALRAKALAYRQAAIDGYLFLPANPNERVPWGAVAWDLEADADKIHRRTDENGDQG